jgi:dipeptidyl aminopeptidase/acylaminoacyl peptidase
VHALRSVVVVAVSALAMLLYGAPAQAVEYSTVPHAATSWKTNGRVYDVMVVGNVVYIAGEFSRVRTTTVAWQDRQRIAAFDRTTGQLLPWNPGADGTVRALAAGDNGVVYAGGTFVNAGGVANSRLAAFDATGASLPGFSAPVGTGEVRDLAFHAGSLFLSGAFGKVGTSSRRAVAKVDGLTGAVDKTFNARVGSGKVYAIKVEGDRLVIGGTFVGLAGVTTTRTLAAVTLDTGAVSRTFSVCDCSIFDLDTFVEGSTTFVYIATGGGGGRVVKLSMTTGAQVWTRNGDGDVQAIDVFDGNVYAGGHFGPTFNGQRRNQLAVLNTAGVLSPMSVPFTGKAKPGLWAVEADAQGLLVGGGFQGITGGSPVATDFATFASFPVR